MTGIIPKHSRQLVLVLLLVQSVQANMSKNDLMQQLMKTCSYNKDSLTIVDTHIEIYEIAQTENQKQEFTFDLYIRMMWDDNRCNYSSLANYSKIEFSEDHAEQIWQPDVLCLSDRKPELHEKRTANRMIYIYRNGSIVYSERTSLTLRSSFDLTFYPYDEQICTLELQSFTYTNESVVLRWHDSVPVRLSGAKLAEFQISVGEICDGDKPPMQQVGVYSSLKASIILTRTGNAHFFQLYGPSFAVAFVSWLALFLDEKRISPRLTVHTGCIIALTTQWIGVYFLIPAVSYIRAIDVWMITHLLLVVSAFLANILSLMARRDDSQNKIDKVGFEKSEESEEILFNRLNLISKRAKENICCCCCGCFLRFVCSCESELGTSDSNENVTANRQGKLIEIVAIIAFFLYYVVFVITYANLIPSKKIATDILLIVVTVGLVGSICLVWFIFYCIRKASCQTGQIVSAADDGSEIHQTESTGDLASKTAGTNSAANTDIEAQRSSL